MIVTVKRYLHVLFLFVCLFVCLFLFFLFFLRGGGGGRGLEKDFCEILMNCDLTTGGRI